MPVQTIVGAQSSAAAISQTLPSLIQAASATQTNVAGAAQVLPGLTQVIVGVQTNIGSAAQTLPNVTQAAEGVSGVGAVISQILPGLTQAASATQTNVAYAAQSPPSITQAMLGVNSAAIVSPAITLWVTKPEGLMSLYLDKLEQLFASAPTLQAATNKAPSIVRAEHVMNDYGWYQDPANGSILHDMRPLIIVGEDAYRFVTDTMTAARGIGVVYSGSYVALITANSIYPGSLDMERHKESKLAFTNFVGKLIGDMERASGQDDNLIFSQAEMVTPCQRTPHQKRSRHNDYWECAFAFSFGTAS